MVKNRIAIICGTALALTLIGGSALAQAPAAGAGQPGQGGQGRGRGGRGASLTTLPVETLDKIVKLTPDQKTKLTVIRDKYTEDSRSLRPQQGQPADPANAAKLRELSTKATQDVEALLTADQKTKWTDARKELALYSSAGIPMGLYGDLKLTDDQKKKLADLQKETAAKTQGIAPDQRRAAMQEARQKAADVLTADQKAAVEKYNKEHPRGRRRQP